MAATARAIVAKPKARTYVSKAEAGLTRERKSVVVERELDRLYTEHGSVTPAQIVEAAQDAASPLHAYFEWDDGIAAEKWRLQQATQMIMATKFVCVLETQRNAPPKVVHAEPVTVRKMLPSFRKEGFVARADIMSDETTRAAFIERKKGELRAWSRSVIDVEELRTIREMIDNAIL